MEALMNSDEIRKDLIKEYLEAVMNGTIKEERLVITKTLDGTSSADIVEVNPNIRSRTEAAKYLGEAIGLFKNETVINLGGTIEAAYARLNSISNLEPVQIDFDSEGEGEGEGD